MFYTIIGGICFCVGLAGGYLLSIDRIRELRAELTREKARRALVERQLKEARRNVRIFKRP